jgi:hypothetical protein
MQNKVVYEAPAAEVVEVKLESAVLQTSVSMNVVFEEEIW